MADIYYIGGSPCCGKSTIAEMFAKKYDFYYLKADDFLDAYIERGSKENLRICKKQYEMNAEQIWMRDAKLQTEEEIEFYKETFTFLKQDLEKLSYQKTIITEGAAYLPELMKAIGITSNHYMALVPTKTFQVEHYKQREWVPYILEGCSDKQTAFKNWMDRDALFALEILKQCKIANYNFIIIDGTQTINQIAKQVANNFGLEY